MLAWPTLADTPVALPARPEGRRGGRRAGHGWRVFRERSIGSEWATKESEAMSDKRLKLALTLFVSWIGPMMSARAGSAGGQGFSYQGQLKQDGIPYNGSADMLFSLRDAISHALLETTVSKADISVVNGLFTVILDFGNGVDIFDGRDWQLELAIRVPHDPTNTAPFTPLVPGQLITTAPYATTARSALTVRGIDGHSLDAADGSPTDALFVDNNGNVGIGTITPSERLSINGNVALTGSSSYEGINGSLGFLSNLGNGQGGVRLSSQGNVDVILDSDNNSTDSSFRIMVNNASRQLVGPVFLINERGNVAIGRSTTNPDSRVDIGGVTDVFSSTTAPNTEVVIRHLLNTDIPAGFTSTTADLKLQATRDRSSPTSTRTQTTGFLTAEVNEDGTQLLHMLAESDNTDIAFETSAGEAMRVTAARRVGIGTTTPDNTLHIQKASAGTITGNGNAPLIVENSGSTYINLLSPDASESGVLFGKPTGGNAAGGIIYDNSAAPDGLQFRTNGNATRMAIDAAGNVGIGTVGHTIDARLHVQSDDARVAKFDRYTTDGQLVAWARDDGVVGDVSVSGQTVSYNAFTGSHYAWSRGSIPAGMLVSMTGENHRFGDREGAEVVYGVMETVRANDPACLGVCMGPEESNKAPGPENPLLVAAVGNGEMWVADGGTGDIEPGDYLITSEVIGCAMKDDPTRFPVGHVIARTADRVHWADHASDEHGQHRVRISVLFTSFERIGNPIAAQFQAAVVTGFAMAAMKCENSARILEKDRKIAELEVRLERIEALMPHAEIRH